MLPFWAATTQVDNGTLEIHDRAVLDPRERGYSDQNLQEAAGRARR